MLVHLSLALLFSSVQGYATVLGRQTSLRSSSPQMSASASRREAVLGFASAAALVTALPAFADDTEDGKDLPAPAAA